MPAAGRAGGQDDRTTLDDPDMIPTQRYRSADVPTPWGAVRIELFRHEKGQTHISIWLPDGDD